MTELILPGETALSAKEHAQWLLHRLVPDRGVCNAGAAFRIGRQVRWWPLQQALNQLSRRHPALRTVPHVDGQVVRKRVMSGDVDFPLTTEAATEETLPALLRELVARPFAFDREPLARAHLVLLPSGSVICLVIHHLVIDHTSYLILRDEVARLYDAFAAGEEVPPALAATVPWHTEPAPDRKHVDYWVHHLAGVDPSALALPGARATPDRPTFAGARVERRMPEDVRAVVERIQQRIRLTENMVLLGAFYVLLARHGAGPDLVVATPVDVRPPGLADVVGFHTNTLPLRLVVDGGTSVTELLRRVTHALLSAMEHDSASFEAVLPALPQRAADWRVPLFRHMFNYMPMGAETPRLGGEPLELIEVDNTASRLDLEWRVISWPDRLEIRVVYSTEVHDAEVVHRLLERYDAILVDMYRALDRPVCEVSARSHSDHAAWARLNATTRPFPDGSLRDEIRARATAAPEADAVRGPTGSLTYAGLLTAAEAVRRALVARGVRPGEPVALCAARRPELAAAVLGVWAAGAAYLPLDPAHPVRRHAEQLDDAGARIVLADREPDPSCLTGRAWLDLDAACEAGAVPAGGAEPWPAIAPSALAYVIYTSGSTGQPKGVEVSHGSLANVVRDFAMRLPAGPHDRTLWLTTFSFDISTLELLLPLTTGGVAVIASDGERAEPEKLLDRVKAEDVTIVQATPTLWRQVAGQLRGRLRGRRVLSGGEPLNGSLARQLLADGCQLFNVYGPTETTIWSTVAELSAPIDDPVPVGTPIANTTVNVLDEQGLPVLPGMPGELCIGGAGVAIGYRGQPELTARSFVDSAELGRYYRTGDQVRLEGSGLVFLGRRDRQVKIRGHRLELTEIESVLESHPEVRAAAVLPELDAAGNRRLVAALQPEHGTEPAAEAVRAVAAERLPDAAVPSRYVWLSELPVTGNGKVDLRALEDLTSRSDEVAELPTDPVLRTLTELWRKVLDDQRLGPDANFFVSGGHSLLAVELAERIGETLGVDVGFDAVFDAPSPDRFAARLAVSGHGARRVPA